MKRKTNTPMEMEKLKDAVKRIVLENGEIYAGVGIIFAEMIDLTIIYGYTRYRLKEQTKNIPEINKSKIEKIYIYTSKQEKIEAYKIYIWRKNQ